LALAAAAPPGLETVKLVSDRRSQAVCSQCLVADTPFARMKGLLGRKELGAGQGLLLRRTWSIHTLFMRFPIDAVFLDRDMRVLSMRTNLKPWRAAAHRGAKAVLELAAGECDRHGTGVGDVLRVEAAD
jgi:uncharacterized membrane protein (UPF0127 family)